MKNIFIGTGGYYYSGWKPFFYPEDLKSREFLSYYSRFFNFVEINSSYYRPVTRKQLIRMIDQVPQDFLFTVKAHKSITHERLDPDRNSIYLRFHGRNRELWWTGDSTSRYDYTYTGEELLERLKDTVPMRKSGKLIFAAFNNHYKGQAVKNAMEAKKIFERYPE